MGANVSAVHETSPTKTNESLTTKCQVTSFHSSSKWKVHFEASKQSSKPIVIDFTASWSGPCRHIQPATNEFAETHEEVDFIKSDVDELTGNELYEQDVAQEFGVQKMLTFVGMKRGKEVDKVVGAKKEDLRKKIEKHRI